MPAKGFSNPFTEKNNPFKDNEKQKIFNPFKDKPATFPTDIFNGALAKKESAKKVRDYATANKIIEEEMNAFGERAQFIPVRSISDKGVANKVIWVPNPNWKKPGPPKPRPDQTITVRPVAPLPSWRSTPWVNNSPQGIFGYSSKEWQNLDPNQRVFAYIHHMIRFDKKSQIFSNSPLESPEIQSFITAVAMYITLTSARQSDRAAVAMNGLFEFVVTMTPKMLSAAPELFEFLRDITHSRSPTTITQHPWWSTSRTLTNFHNFMDGLFAFDLYKRQELPKYR